MKENYRWVRVVCVVLSLVLVAMGAWQFVELLCALPGQLLSWLRQTGGLSATLLLRVYM